MLRLDLLAGRRKLKRRKGEKALERHEANCLSVRVGIFAFL